MANRMKCYSYIYRQTQSPCVNCSTNKKTDIECSKCSNLQQELELMKTKLEKIEKERNDYKMQMDKLENRVSCVIVINAIYNILSRKTYGNKSNMISFNPSK